MRHHFISTSLLCVLLASLTSRAADTPSITVGTFKQEVRREFTAADGLPATAATAVAVLDAQTVLAGTTNGLARFANGRWTSVSGAAGAPVEALATSKDKVFLVQNGRLLSLEGGKARLAEVTLAAGSPAIGIEIANMGLPRESTVVALLRDAHVVVPRGDTVLRQGDEVLVLVTGDAEDDVRRLLVG